MEPETLECLWTCVGRRNNYAIQQRDGRYFRVKKPVTEAVLARHLAGKICIGTYVLDEEKRCPFAIFDADQSDGLTVLRNLQMDLARQGFPAYLERSRRGGHLWLFFHEPCPAELVRAWLLPLATAHHLELFPKQSTGRGVGSLIRLPLGVHQRSGKRYPFLNGDLQPMAHTLPAQLQWLAEVQRITPPLMLPLAPTRSLPENASFTSLQGSNIETHQSLHSIQDWNAAQNPFVLIERYVKLNHNGSGCCPFGSHHAGGHDSRASFQVFHPQRPGGICWYCYAWGHGGNAFDFLCYYYGLDAKTLWHRILAGDLP